jgi:hypothetical protein
MIFLLYNNTVYDLIVELNIIFNDYALIFYF